MSDRSAKVNDLVLRFANVNGTGSASANNLFAKAVFRMGIPVSPKNIFPSNIQGLPTWFEVRVSEKGYLGRREGVDLMVSVNPQSMMEDLAEVQPGGYFLYDNTKSFPTDGWRKDIHLLGVPMMQLCLDHFDQPRQQQLMKNIVYVGALMALLDLEQEVLHLLVEELFGKKPALVALNKKALQLGSDYAHQHFDCPLPVRLERRTLTGESILVEGNEATALGALYGGATVAAWYPITPSTSVVQAFDRYARELRRDPETGKIQAAVVQAEDELAAIGMVIGAAWNGARAFTATSGPGVSLMSEFIGLAYFAEIPVVLVDVQRGGPSTGMPTRTQQSDLLSCAYASHGDTKHVLLFPSNPAECFAMTALALDLADRLQTPIMVMSDLDLGMNYHLSPPFRWEADRRYDRGKVLSAEDLEEIQDWGRYLDQDGDGIPYRTIPGTHPTKGAYFTRGTSKDEYARYTEKGADYVRVMERMMKKWETAKGLVPPAETYQTGNRHSRGVVFFGTTAHSAQEAFDLLLEKEVGLDALRIRGFPFDTVTEDFFRSHEEVFVVEQNRDGQMRSLAINELDLDPHKLISICNYDGMPITADFIYRSILAHLPDGPASNHRESQGIHA